MATDKSPWRIHDHNTTVNPHTCDVCMYGKQLQLIPKLLIRGKEGEEEDKWRERANEGTVCVRACVRGGGGGGGGGGEKGMD